MLTYIYIYIYRTNTSPPRLPVTSRSDDRCPALQNYFTLSQVPVKKNEQVDLR